jgi:LysW-gamma-L-lysine carboxypeptidase
MTESELKLNNSLGLSERSKKDQEKKESRILFGAKLLSAYSPSGEEGEAIALLQYELQTHKLFPRIDSAGNLICEIGSGARSLLLCPHIDTVPGVLPVRRQGTLLFGRGAVDAKGALLAMLFAFEDMAESLIEDPARLSKIHLIFAVVVEEEKESKGLSQLIRDNVRADAAIFGEPGGASRLTIGYRGHLPAYFQISTREGHSSAPWLTTNAAEVAFSLYESLQQCLVARQDKSMDSVSVALTSIQAGTSHNVVPGHANMTVDIRVPTGKNTSEIANVVSQTASEASEKFHCIISAKFGEATEPYKAKLDSKIVRSMTRSMIRHGLKPSFISKSGTGDMNTYALTLGVDAVTYGPGDPKLSHTEFECVGMDDIVACSEVLMSACQEFFDFA